MTAATIPRWDRETRRVAALAAFVSLATFLYCFQHNLVLLYGDAVGHINIARRVFDSRTPGLLQLGTVWLPLPHLLILPFVISDKAWMTGFGGSIPSLAAFVAGAVGLFRLVRQALAADPGASAGKRIAPWCAVAIYTANPNLLYVQSTALTEPLYLAFFIWAVVFFSEFVAKVENASSALVKCGACLFAACLTRYDGWFLTAAVFSATLLVGIRRRNLVGMRPALAKFVLIAAAGPVLWIAYNAIVYRNPLEFANGPYSAKGIEERTTPRGAASHPGSHDPVVAQAYFLKAAELNMMEGNWHRLWTALLLVGGVVILVCERRLWPLFLLWAPWPFYALSIAYGGVPIFLPVWWPFSLYNARYGVQFLPAFAVFTSIVLYFSLKRVSGLQMKVAIGGAFAVFILLSYFSVWHTGPVSFREGWVNSRTRIALETTLARNLRALPPTSNILMYLGDHVGALQQAGIPLRRVINEGNHRTWKQPLDPKGLWERALADPAKYADYVVSMEGDPVSQQVRRDQLTTIEVIHVQGQPLTTLYRCTPTQ